MLAAIYNRVSTERQQQEGVSLQTQREACIKYAQEHGYEADDKYILDEVFSGLKLDRPNLNRLLAWIKKGEVQAVIIYSSDRFSRDGYDLLTLVRECDVNNVALLCVSEDMGKGETGELINFIRGWASGLEAKRIGERSMRNKRRKAECGHIVSGYGRHNGYYGLQYDKNSKAFEHVAGQIDIAQEILRRYINGESANSITKDLQAREVRATAGKLFHRSGVNRILAHARVYAGLISWNGIEIRGKIKPIITESDVETIEKRLQMNRQFSLGFGRRKWFSGRVFCGICGRRYVMDARKGCRCNANDSRSPVKCSSPKVPYGLMERLLAKSLLMAYTDEEAVVLRATEAYQSWGHVVHELDTRQEGLERELGLVDERRLRLSTQHELSLINDGELAERLLTVENRQNEILDAIYEIQKFKAEKLAPADPEKVRQAFSWIKRVREGEPLLTLLSKNPERHRLGGQLADILNFRATVVSNGQGGGFRLEVSVNIPLDHIEIQEQSSCAMVFSTSSWSDRREVAKRYWHARSHLYCRR